MLIADCTTRTAHQHTMTVCRPAHQSWLNPECCLPTINPLQHYHSDYMWRGIKIGSKLGIQLTISLINSHLCHHLERFSSDLRSYAMFFHITVSKKREQPIKFASLLSVITLTSWTIWAISSRSVIIRSFQINSVGSSCFFFCCNVSLISAQVFFYIILIKVKCSLTIQHFHLHSPSPSLCILTVVFLLLYVVSRCFRSQQQYHKITYKSLYMYPRAEKM